VCYEDVSVVGYEVPLVQARLTPRQVETPVTKNWLPARGFQDNKIILYWTTAFLHNTARISSQGYKNWFCKFYLSCPLRSSGRSFILTGIRHLEDFFSQTGNIKCKQSNDWLTNARLTDSVTTTCIYLLFNSVWHVFIKTIVKTKQDLQKLTQNMLMAKKIRTWICY